MAKRKSSSKGGQARLINERIERLLELAEDNALAHPERSKRYVGLARKLGTRYRVKLGPERKRRFCSKCNAYWVPGKNVSVKTDSVRNTVIWECECGAKRVRKLGKKPRNK